MNELFTDEQRIKIIEFAKKENSFLTLKLINKVPGRLDVISIFHYMGSISRDTLILMGKEFTQSSLEQNYRMITIVILRDNIMYGQTL